MQTQVRRSRAEADRVVEEFEASGLSRREWARQTGVSVNTLDLYRKQRGRVGTRERPWQAAASGGAGAVAESMQAGSGAEARPTELKAGPNEAKLEAGQAAAGPRSGTQAKAAERKAAERPVGLRPAAPAATPRWIEVRAEAPPAAGGTGLRLLSPGGWRVEVEAGFDAATLRRLLQVLETAAPEQG